MSFASLRATDDYLPTLLFLHPHMVPIHKQRLPRCMVARAR